MAGRSAGDRLVPVSRRRLGLFRMYIRSFVRRHFHAVRIAHAERFLNAQAAVARPLIVYVNHPSWWDPLIGMLLAEFLMPGTEQYAPMDAAALAHYGIFRRLGAFPVQQGTVRGGVQFVRSSMGVLGRSNAVLWVTPQGTFSDVRTRPVVFRGGLTALVERVPGVTVLPIAFEYAFWDERLPEALINVGAPFKPDANGGNLEQSLAETLDELALLSKARDGAAFKTLLSGSAGAGQIYAMWQRLRAIVTGREYVAEHARLGSAPRGREGRVLHGDHADEVER